MPSGSFHKQLSPTAAVGKRMGSSDNKMPTGKEHLRLQPLDHSDFATLEKGHRVCRLVVQKKFDIVYRRIWLNSQTHQIALTKCTGSQTDFGDVAGTSSNFPSSSSSKTHTLDLRLVKDAQILEQVENTMQIMEKWRRDSALLRFDQAMVLCIGWGAAFNLNNWLILFESKEACNLWCQGLRQLCAEQQNASHALVVERWLRKQFYALLPHPTDTACITIKHMKPFVQQRLQCKVSSKQLQEITEGDMGFEGFVLAHNRLLDFHSLFTSMFAEYASHELPLQVPFKRFVDFLRDVQHDKLGQSRAFASDFLRRYLRDVDSDRDMTEPCLSTEEFMDYLYSPENSLFDPINKEVVHDMSKPLTHYWISSSHNTYLTGDQLKSESSLDAYSRALLLGCRCIELDCWDGCQRKGANGGELIIDIVIYHGYTMTSKLALRDVLQTIKRYAFQTSEFPVILSIEDNCSVPAQRQMAVDIQEVLGDMLLTAPVSRDEWQLPSPTALRHKIILKHKKLCRQHQKRQQLDGSDSVSLLEDELDQQDILSRRCIKKGVLWLRASGGTGQKAIWAKHIFVLFADRLCYLVQPVDDKNDGTAVADGAGKTTAARENSLGSQGDENLADDSSSVGGGNNIDACVDAHLTEEWFHGKIDRDTAKSRLLENAKELFTSAEVGGGGLFLIRESSTFIGDFTLSFVHAGQVHHCRIKATLTAGGERKYHLLDTVRRDTLYELISYYTRHSLDTPNFKTFLQTPCPQPQPHLVQPWFSGQADTQRAEELLAAVAEDGAFLIRHSTQDRNVFVLSLRVDAKVWHYRLKRDGRLFVVNQQMFENLCQLVDYYGQQQFVRGVCLKYPVNEKTVDQYANKNPARLNGSDLSALDSSFGGYYMELRDLEKEVQAEAMEPFEASAEFEAKHLPSLLAPQKFLRFPIGAHITILHKTTGKEEQQNIIESRTDEKAEKEQQQQQQPVSLWLGRYNNEIGWFPASCVQGFSPSTEQMDEASPAELNFGTIELVGTTFEESDSTDRAHSFQISLDQSHWNVQQYLVAAECQEELDDWLDACRKQVRLANDKIHQLRTKEKQLRIASELSSLVVYCQAVPFDPDFELQDPRLTFYEMCSFSEYKHEKLIERGLPLFNQRQLSRVYPQASRLTSTNFNPIPMWNSGCHMVALNFQTGDKPMQLNAGRFAANGRCGYVLKPQYLMDEMFRQQQPRASSANDIGRATQKCPKCVFSRRSTGNLPSLNSLSATLPGNKNRQPTNSKNAGTKSNHPPKLSLTISNSIEEELTIDDNCWTAEKVKEEMDGNCTCQCLTSEGNKTTEEEEAIDNDETATNMQAKGINTSLSHLNCPIAVDILLIAGRHLSRKGGQENKRGGICSPCVEIELLGFSHDSQMQKSGTITTNGLNPVWQERFHFRVQHPEMCLLRFHVEDGDFVGPKTDPFIGQSTLPLDCIRTGFRSVPLFNQFSEPLELSALLLYVNICHWNPNSTVEVGPTPSLPHRPSNSFLGSGSAVSAWLFDSTTAFGVIPASTAKADGCDGCTADNVRNESSQSEGIGGSPIWDVHQMLQAGRSTASHPSEEEENSLAGQMGKIRRENSSLESTGRIHHLNSTSNFGRGNSRTSRSTSMESSETTTTSSSAFMLPPAKRTMGTNTLRRFFFRMGRNGGNITKK